VAQGCEAAPVSRVAAQGGLPPETVRRMDKRGLRRWANLDWEARQTLNDLFALNRRLAKAYVLKEPRVHLWPYTYEGAARRFLTNWLLALRWQRLPAFQKLGRMLTRHRDGILNYCHEKVPFGTVEAINGNIRAKSAPGPGLPRPRVSAPQSAEGHRQPPPPSDRMNTRPPTDPGEEREHQRATLRPEGELRIRDWSAVWPPRPRRPLHEGSTHAPGRLEEAGQRVRCHPYCGRCPAATSDRFPSLSTTSNRCCCSLITRLSHFSMGFLAAFGLSTKKRISSREWALTTV
jgi:hypothetical protein